MVTLLRSIWAVVILHFLCGIHLVHHKGRYAEWVRFLIDGGKAIAPHVPDIGIVRDPHRIGSTAVLDGRFQRITWYPTMRARIASARASYARRVRRWAWHQASRLIQFFAGWASQEDDGDYVEFTISLPFGWILETSFLEYGAFREINIRKKISPVHGSWYLMMWTDSDYRMYWDWEFPDQLPPLVRVNPIVQSGIHKGWLGQVGSIWFSLRYRRMLVRSKRLSLKLTLKRL